MFKYLYLEKKEWANTWINGGVIPISLASSYLSEKRDGIYTPDENLIHESEVDLKSFAPVIKIADEANIKNFSFINCTINGKIIPDINNANYYKEDGYILSFSNIFSEDLARRLKKECCIKVVNLQKLKKIIDNQMGKKGVMNNCAYTKDHKRNHFTKSVEDEWQQEFRMYWSIKNNFKKTISVKMPSGHATLMATYETA